MKHILPLYIIVDGYLYHVNKTIIRARIQIPWYEEFNLIYSLFDVWVYV